jgi:hypothetical protein
VTRVCASGPSSILTPSDSLSFLGSAIKVKSQNDKLCICSIDASRVKSSHVIDPCSVLT